MNAARLMYKQGEEYSTASGRRGTALGADHLFPIFVWCTIHANIPDVCTRIAWLRSFATSRETMSEMGYYLTTLEAAVEHVVCDLACGSASSAFGLRSALVFFSCCLI